MDGRPYMGSLRMVLTHRDQGVNMTLLTSILAHMVERRTASSNPEVVRQVMEECKSDLQKFVAEFGVGMSDVDIEKEDPTRSTPYAVVQTLIVAASHPLKEYDGAGIHGTLIKIAQELLAGRTGDQMAESVFPMAFISDEDGDSQDYLEDFSRRALGNGDPFRVKETLDREFPDLPVGSVAELAPDKKVESIYNPTAYKDRVGTVNLIEASSLLGEISLVKDGLTIRQPDVTLEVFDQMNDATAKGLIRCTLDGKPVPLGYTDFTGFSELEKTGYPLHYTTTLLYPLPVDGLDIGDTATLTVEVQFRSYDEPLYTLYDTKTVNFPVHVRSVGAPHQVTVSARNYDDGSSSLYFKAPGNENAKKSPLLVVNKVTEPGGYEGRAGRLILVADVADGNGNPLDNTDDVSVLFKSDYGNKFFVPTGDGGFTLSDSYLFDINRASDTMDGNRFVADVQVAIDGTYYNSGSSANRIRAEAVGVDGTPFANPVTGHFYFDAIDGYETLDKAKTLGFKWAGDTPCFIFMNTPASEMPITAEISTWFSGAGGEYSDTPAENQRHPVSQPCNLYTDSIGEIYYFGLQKFGFASSLDGADYGAVALFHTDENDTPSTAPLLLPGKEHTLTVDGPSGSVFRVRTDSEMPDFNSVVHFTLTSSGCRKTIAAEVLEGAGGGF